MTPTPKPLSDADVDVGILRLPEKAARDFASLSGPAMPVPAVSLPDRKYLGEMACNSVNDGVSELVRRQSFWDSERLKIRESLARQVCNVMRLDDGASSDD